MAEICDAAVVCIRTQVGENPGVRGGEGVERIDVEVDIGSWIGLVARKIDADADANARRKAGRGLLWRGDRWDVRMADGMPKLDVCRPRPGEPGGGDLDGDIVVVVREPE